MPGHDDDTARDVQISRATLEELSRQARRSEHVDAARDHRDLLLASDPDLTPEDVDILNELEQSIADQQQQLEARLGALAQATDPAAKQDLQGKVESLRGEIAELTHLRDELKSNGSRAPAPAASTAQAAASKLEQRMDRQQRQDELKLDERQSQRETAPQ